MSGSFSGISMAGNALRAFQYGMDVTGHNLSNVNTVGYTRQTVEFAANDPITRWYNRPFQLGQGVTISSINRIRDQFLDARMQGAQGDLGRSQTLTSSMSQIEPLFNEPGTSGIGSALDRFFNAWSALGSNPSEGANRIEVQQAGATLSNRIRGTFANLNVQSQQVSAEIQQTVLDINALTQRIAELNDTIRQQVAVGGAPNDLLDQRDLAIEQLSGLVNVNTTPAGNGDVHVHFGGYPLIDIGGAHAFPATLNSTTYSATVNGQSFAVRGGKLAGLMDASNAIADYKSSLDTLANTLRKEVNLIHRSGTNPNGGTNVAFFVDNAVDPQNGAIDFALHPDILNDPDNIVSSVAGTAGDGSLALSISDMKNANLTMLSGKSFGKWYSDFISGVGRDSLGASESLKTQEAMAAQVELQRQSVSGVSLDDEMANMLKFQRSYQAAAKVLSIFDQVTEEIIGLIR